MSELNAPEYYRRREQQERAMAMACTNPAIAAIHVEMAVRYAKQWAETGHQSDDWPKI